MGTHFKSSAKRFHEMKRVGVKREGVEGKGVVEKRLPREERREEAY